MIVIKVIFFVSLGFLAFSLLLGLVMKIIRGINAKKKVEEKKDV